MPAPVAPPLGVDQPRHELAMVLSDSGPDNAEMAYVPPPRPVCPLLARRGGCAQRTAAVDRRRRALAQDEQELAHDVAALRNDLR